VNWTDGPPPLEWQGVVSYKDLRRGFYLDLLTRLEEPDFDDLEWFSLDGEQIFERVFLDAQEMWFAKFLEWDLARVVQFRDDFFDGIRRAKLDLLGIRSPLFRDVVIALIEHPETKGPTREIDDPKLLGFGWDQASPSERREILGRLLRGYFGFYSESYPWILRDAELDAWQEPEF
jgi:hypothetical protein